MNTPILPQSDAGRRLREILSEADHPVPVAEISQRLADTDITDEAALFDAVAARLQQDDAFIVFHDHRGVMVCLATDPDARPVRPLECRMLDHAPVAIPILVTPRASAWVSSLAA